MEWSVNHQIRVQSVTDCNSPLFSLCLTFTLSFQSATWKRKLMEVPHVALPLKVYHLRSPPVESPHYWKMFHLPFSSLKFNLKITALYKIEPSPLLGAWSVRRKIAELRCYWMLAHHLILHYIFQSKQNCSFTKFKCPSLLNPNPASNQNEGYCN